MADPGRGTILGRLWKRAREVSSSPVDASGDDDRPAKRSKLEYAALLSLVQDEINGLDEQCAEEQLAIQKKYDERKQPLYQKRGELFSKLPNFWSRVIRAMEIMVNRTFCSDVEKPAIDALKDVSVDINTDRNGSHKYTFRFQKNALFEGVSVERSVRFNDASELEHLSVSPKKIPWRVRPEPALSSTPFLRWLYDCRPESDEDDFGTLFLKYVWEDPFAILKAHEPQKKPKSAEEGASASQNNSNAEPSVPDSRSSHASEGTINSASGSAESDPLGMEDGQSVSNPALSDPGLFSATASAAARFSVAARQRTSEPARVPED